MIAMCFDLSSTCIGVTFAQAKDGKTLSYLETLAIIPKAPNGLDFGYTTKDAKTIHYNGQTFKSYLKKGEVYITKSEGRRRVSEIKNETHKQLLKNIGYQCGRYLEIVKPDMIAIERNKSFNGVLTTKLLAEIAGGLYFYSGMRNIPLYDNDEKTIRAHIRRTIPKFNRALDETGDVALDTKWEIYCRLRDYFKNHYPGLIDFSGMTMDESDSLAVFYHLLTTQLTHIKP